MEILDDAVVNSIAEGTVAYAAPFGQKEGLDNIDEDSTMRAGTILNVKEGS